MAQRVLLCPPAYFDVIDEKNPHMAGKVPVDRGKAERQWQALCASLKEAGCEVETISAVPGLEDMVFAANQVFVGFEEKAGRFVVPSRMVHESRRREVPAFVEWFRQRGFGIVELDLEGEFLEGHGDLIWHPGGSRIYGGHGFRSTRGGVEKFAEAMLKLGITVVPLQLSDPRCYHLDTCFCPLNEDAVLIYPGAFAKESMLKLGKLWKRIYELTKEEAHKFMANGIVANGRYLTPYLTPHLQEILDQERLTPVVLDTSEFEKSGGSLFCMKAFLP